MKPILGHSGSVPSTTMSDKLIADTLAKLEAEKAAPRPNQEAIRGLRRALARYYRGEFEGPNPHRSPLQPSPSLPAPTEEEKESPEGQS